MPMLRKVSIMLYSQEDQIPKVKKGHNPKNNVLRNNDPCLTNVPFHGISNFI